MAQAMSPCLAALFGQMSLDQTGTQACRAPWVTRPLPAKKSTKVGSVVDMGSFEQFLIVVSILNARKASKDLGEDRRDFKDGIWGDAWHANKRLWGQSRMTLTKGDL